MMYIVIAQYTSHKKHKFKMLETLISFAQRGYAAEYLQITHGVKTYYLKRCECDLGNI